MAKVRTLVENKYVVLYNRLRSEKAATVKKARARYDERIKKNRNKMVAHRRKCVRRLTKLTERKLRSS